MPPLVGVIGGVCRVRDRRFQFLLQGESPNQRDSRWLPLGQGSPTENPPEEVHVRLHLEEGLINGDKASEVQYSSWVEVLQLQAPLIEEPTQEPVHGIPEPALKEGKEGDDLIGLGLWNDHPRRKSPPMRDLLRWEQPLLSEGSQHRLIHIGWPLARHLALD